MFDQAVAEPSPDEICSYYGRVSTPRQKLEHQREVVNRYCDYRSILIPEHLRLEDKGRRHKSHQREKFQKLLKLCDDGKIEWIIIATFDRWGVADPDEFFGFRRRLKDSYVRLWSVTDHLELTGCNESDYHRITAQAVACTMQMGMHAERNVSKMLLMAEQGWHASGSVPYGTDLLCCLLSDKDEVLFRLHTIRRPKDGSPLYKIIYADGREELANRMPLRNCKETGYRLTPSIDHKRIEAVRLIYQLFDSGMGYTQMREYLWARGHTHYGKPFQDNALITILQNPAYVGMPAWGKYAIGQYRQVFDRISRRPPRRERGEPAQYVKDKLHFVFPKEPVFAPDAFMPMDLWERVQKSFDIKREQKTNRPRRRNRSNHPLNGKLRCPDCNAQMVSAQAKHRSGRSHYFICGTYAKSERLLCRANSVPWTKLDNAAAEVLERAKRELAAIAALANDDTVAGFDAEHGATVRFMGHLFIEMLEYLGRKTWTPPIDIFEATTEELIDHKEEIQAAYNEVYEAYAKKWEKNNKGRQKRLAEIEKQILKIGKLLEDEPPSKLLRDKWYKEIERLEKERLDLAEDSGNLLAQMQTAYEQADVLYRLIKDAEGLQLAKVWDVLLKEIVPVMEVETMRNGKTRTHLRRLRFVPNEATAEVFDELQIPCTRRGTG